MRSLTPNTPKARPQQTAMPAPAVVPQKTEVVAQCCAKVSKTIAGCHD